MEAHDEIAMKKPVWPQGKPIPSFKSYADEVKFWQSYDFDSDQPEDGWEAVPSSTTKREDEPKHPKRTAKVVEPSRPVRRKRAAGA